MGCESRKLCTNLLILISLLAFARGQIQYRFSCFYNQGNYTSNSTYGANLNTLLTSLPPSIGENGFYNASVGQNQDRVNGLVLCRADQTLDQCQTCVRAASIGIQQLCPNQKQAIVWDDVCMLRYSNESIYGTLSTDPVRNWANTGSVSNITEFRAARTRLINALRPLAANGGPALKVGAGTTDASDSGTLYGLLQCTPDLSADECDGCLRQATEQTRICCDSSPGVRLLLPSCNLRFELYSFYNETRLRELRVPPATVPVPSPPASSLTG